MTEGAYMIYVVISVGLTIWVGRSLFRHGGVFIKECFSTLEAGEAVNRLLLTGFYLVNFGFVCLFLKYGERPVTLMDAIEIISTKIGIVLLVLGGMHFFNMFNIAKMRKKACVKNRHNKKAGDHVEICYE